MCACIPYAHVREGAWGTEITPDPHHPSQNGLCSPTCVDSTGLLTTSLPSGHCLGHRTAQGDEGMPLWNCNEQMDHVPCEVYDLFRWGHPPCLPWVQMCWEPRLSRRAKETIWFLNWDETWLQASYKNSQARNQRSWVCCWAEPDENRWKVYKYSSSLWFWCLDLQVFVC